MAHSSKVISSLEREVGGGLRGQLKEARAGPTREGDEGGEGEGRERKRELH